MNNQQYLETIAENCTENLKAIGIPCGKVKSFSVNTRAKNRWGQTRYNRAGNFYEININIALCDGSHEEGLRNTLYHELLHTCPGCMNHGNLWNRYGRMVQSKLGYKILRCDTAENKGFSSGEYQYNLEPVRYLFQCSECGSLIKRRRESKFTKHYDLYRCGRCGGKFVKISA